MIDRRFLLFTLLAATLWALLGPVSASAQQAPLTLRGPGGETNIVADRIQQIGGDERFFASGGRAQFSGQIE
jgi:hypothetical protein